MTREELRATFDRWQAARQSVEALSAQLSEADTAAHEAEAEFRQARQAFLDEALS